MLPKLPSEILIHVIKFLDIKHSLALCYTSREIFEKLVPNKIIVDRLAEVCCQGNVSVNETKLRLLEIQETWENNQHFEVWNGQFLSYIRSKIGQLHQRITRSLELKKFNRHRIVFDLNLICDNFLNYGPCSKDDLCQGDTKLNPCFQYIEHQVENEKTTKTSLTHSCRKSETTWQGMDPDMISQTVITYSVSQDYLVLVLSPSMENVSPNINGLSISVWDLAGSRGPIFKYTTDNGHQLWEQNVLIFEEDILAYKNWLFILPYFHPHCSPSPDHLQVYNLSHNHLPQVARYRLAAGKRCAPLIEKEGSASRLHIYGSRLAMLISLPHWTLYLLDISPIIDEDISFDFMSGIYNLNCVFRVRLSNIESALTQPFTLYANDQKGPHLLLGMVGKSPDNDSSNTDFSQVIASIDLRANSKKSVGYIWPSDWGQYVDLVPRIPKLTPDIEELNTGLAHEMYLTCCDSGHRLAILTNQGIVLTMDRRADSGPQVNKVNLMPWCQEITDLADFSSVSKPQDTFYDQLVWAEEDQLLALKVFTPHKFIHSFTFSKGERIWSLDLARPEFCMNSEQRLFISIVANLLLVTDPSSSTVLELESGKLVTRLLLPKVERVTEELDRESYHGYAACAYGAWEVIRLGSNKILVVHDIERTHPIIADMITLNL